MTDYFVDDGGNDSDGLSWATAYTSAKALQDAVAAAFSTSDNRIFFGADHACQATHSASLTIVGPTSSPPVYLISSTVGSGTAVSYAKSSTGQIDVSEGGFNLIFDGAFAIYGLCVKAGGSIFFNPDADEFCYTDNMTARPAANGTVSMSFNLARIQHRDLTVDLTADGSSNRSGAVLDVGAVSSNHQVNGLSFVNAGYRTGVLFSGGNPNGPLWVSGADFSGFTNGTDCEIWNGGRMDGPVYFTNCKTKSSVTFTSTVTSKETGFVLFTNCGPEDDPVQLALISGYGSAIASSSIYRTGGAAVEGVATSWLVTTTTGCSEGSPFYTPWIYGTVSSTGSKTFTLYITNDTADLTDAEIWLEVEYLKDADEALWTLITDQRATITTTAAAQTDDTTSTWNGAGPSFTYKQSLAVTAVIGETGQFRARVAVGKASIAGSAYLYVDPKINIS